MHQEVRKVYYCAIFYIRFFSRLIMNPFSVIGIAIQYILNVSFISYIAQFTFNVFQAAKIKRIEVITKSPMAR